tara:strand:- start:121 stop:510 length:390 start_codon:yes stop_codon:yes gene_type:complete
MRRSCKIVINNYEIIAELSNSLTASKIWDSLPISSTIKTWGNEIYFHTSTSAEIEENAKEVIQLGEIVYWPTGKAIAIGFGKTPISEGDEIRLASKCNVWAKTKFDLKKLINIHQGENVLVEKSIIEYE